MRQDTLRSLTYVVLVALIFAAALGLLGGSV